MTHLPIASLRRRLAALLYELLLITAVTFFALMLAALLIYLLPSKPPLPQIIISLVLITSWYAYFVPFWQKGQTLAMKTWQLKLINRTGMPPSRYQLRWRFFWALMLTIGIAALIYSLSKSWGYPPQWAFALAGIAAFLPFITALFSTRRQFLHDLLAGTLLVVTHPDA